MTRSKAYWAITAAFSAAAMFGPLSASAQSGATNGEWRYFGGDGGHTQYTPLAQIDRTNVKNLKIAWRWKAANTGSTIFDLQSTPLMVGGVLYTSTGVGEVAAVDARKGVTKWLFTPDPRNPGERLVPGSGRGVAYWTDGRMERIFHHVPDGRLVSIDAKTGKIVTEFGAKGYVDLRLDGTNVRALSTPVVAKDVVVSQVTPVGNGIKAAPADIRGYDARTGKQLWVFHVVPREGEFGVETWENDSWKYSGHSGIWSLMSVDADLGIVYLPTENATGDFVGVARPGNNLFANSIVALDIKTGKRLWHYQLVHHDIWDTDSSAPPTLLDVNHDGKRVKAIAIVGKGGFVYTFDRVTGAPLWPIVEMAVPQSDVPGEKTSRTQPIPSRPAPFERQTMSVDELIDLTPELREEAMKIVANYRMGRVFTPGSLIDAADGTKGTIYLPGWGGGASWPGAGADPETGMLYIPSISLPTVLSFEKVPQNARGDAFAYATKGGVYLDGPRGLPLIKPPWGRITAIDMNSGDHVWMKANGAAPQKVRDDPQLQGKGLDFSKMGQNGRPGTLVTKTLLFLGEGGGVRGGAESRFGAGGPTFRAYDKRTGDVVAELTLPLNPTSPPMSYMLDGKQYIVMAAAQNAGQRSDKVDMPAELIALALP